MVRLDDVKSYANEKQIFSIPQMQKDLGIGYFDARKFVNELIDGKLAVLQDGVTYRYKRPKEREKGTIDTLSSERERLMMRFAQREREQAPTPVYNPKSPLFGIRIKENVVTSAKYGIRVDRKSDGDVWLEMRAGKLFDGYMFRVKIIVDEDKIKLSDTGLWLAKRDSAGKKTPENEKLCAEILADAGVSCENGEIFTAITETSAFEGYMAMYNVAVRILSL